jgi:LPXTG-site transpeptidase (sortase) family protein
MLMMFVAARYALIQYLVFATSFLPDSFTTTIGLNVVASIDWQDTVYNNSIYFPSLDHQVPIYTDKDTGLNTGGWLKSKSMPGDIDNVVIIGHRYETVRGVRPFFNLHKLSVGQTVVVSWDNRVFNYRISDIVSEDEVNTSVEAATPGLEKLTLYTCDLLHRDKRLVIIAIPVSS